MDAAIVFRCDADETIGLGHAMRCFALAEAARDKGWKCVVATRRMPRDIQLKFLEAGVAVLPVTDVRTPADAARFMHISAGRDGWIVIDLKACSQDDQRLLLEDGSNVAVIDDGQLDAFAPVDAIVNPNIEATRDLYDGKTSPGTDLLLGLKYFPLRSSLRGSDNETRAPGPARILVTMGGADPDGFTAPLAQALAKAAHGAVVTALIGPATPKSEQTMKAIAEEAPNVRIRANVGDSAEILREHDIVVTLAGLTLWEAAAGGAAVFAVARDAAQRAVVKEADANGLLAGVFDAAGFDPKGAAERIAAYAGNAAGCDALAARARKAVDGQGAARVIDALAAKSMRRAS